MFFHHHKVTYQHIAMLNFQYSPPSDNGSTKVSSTKYTEKFAFILK